MTNKLYKPLLIDSVKVSADLEEHRFVGFDGNYCSAGAKALGVVDAATSKGQYAPVGLIGIFLVEAAEDIAIGDEIASDDSGKAIKVLRTELVNGYALDNGTAGETIRILRGI